jgi:Terminase small subunit
MRPKPKKKSRVRANRKRRLSQKQLDFCSEYVRLLAEGVDNATEACRRAGYKGTPGSLRVLAHENLTNPNILEIVDDLKSKIEQRPDPIASSYEVLDRMSRRARGRLSDILNSRGQVDLLLAKERGTDNIIKSATFHSNGSVRSVRLYDADRADYMIGQYYRLWERGERPIDDPEAVLAMLLGVRPKQLPPADFDADVDGEVPDAKEASEEPAV